MKKAQDILNRLTLGGIAILLSVWTATATESFVWKDSTDPSAGYTYTETLEINPSSCGGSFNVSQINVANLAASHAEGTSTEGIDFSLTSVVVSMTLDVPAYNEGWQIQSPYGLTGLYVTEMEAAVTYSLQISPDGGEPMVLSATSSMGPVTGYIDEHPNYETGATDPGISPVAMAAASSNPQEFNITTFPENSTDPIATYNYNTLQSEVTYDDNIDFVEALANNPGVRLKVTITYNVVPEPGVLSLLVVGTAFLLRRRKFRLA